MNIAPELIYNVGLLFVMMLPGIILKKCGLSTDGLGKGISNLVLYIAQPALIFLAYLRPFDKAVLLNVVYVFLFSIVAHVLFTVVAMHCFKKVPDGRARMLRFATIFSNAAFMGIPLISAVLGPEATIYASVYNITFNLFLWSLGVRICTANRDANSNGVDDFTEARDMSGVQMLKKTLLHPVTLAAALGLLFFFLPIDTYVPSFVTESLSMLRDLVAPLSMVVLGLRLADMNFKGFFGQSELYLFILLRHIMLPVAVFAIMRLLLPLGLGYTMDAVLCVLIMASAPAASSATMFAEKFDCDADYVSKLVAFSTIISIATMPLLSLLAKI